MSTRPTGKRVSKRAKAVTGLFRNEELLIDPKAIGDAAKRRRHANAALRGLSANIKRFLTGDSKRRRLQAKVRTLELRILKAKAEKTALEIRLLTRGI